MSECCKKKQREPEELKSLINRLNRIEGQVRGIKGMIENNCYCIDVLTQVSAVQSAITAFSHRLLENHIQTCVVNGIKNDDENIVTELIETLKRMK